MKSKRVRGPSRVDDLLELLEEQPDPGWISYRQAAEQLGMRQEAISCIAIRYAELIERRSVYQESKRGRPTGYPHTELRLG